LTGTVHVHSVSGSSHSVNGDIAIQWVSASEMTYIVSSGALNSTHSLTHVIRWEWSNFEHSENPNPLTDYDKLFKIDYVHETNT